MRNFPIFAQNLSSKSRLSQVFAVRLFTNQGPFLAELSETPYNVYNNVSDVFFSRAVSVYAKQNPTVGRKTGEGVN